MSTYVVLGTGVTGRAVATALRDHDEQVVLLDDHPTAGSRVFAEALGVELIEAPDEESLRAVLAESAVLLPSPGVPDRHPIFSLAVECGVEVQSEFDLARRWDTRPLAAITGTNGKTTVTMMVTDMLEVSGVHAAAVGNTETPLVAALPDDSIEVFVVEASSFRLGHTQHLHPSVAAWLNFAPDHLDVHESLESYEAAKASMWAQLDDPSRAVAVIDDPVVRAHAPAGATTVGVGGQWHTDGVHLHGPDGPILAVDELRRSLPHDQVNALVAAAVAVQVGASITGVRTVLETFAGLPHRVEHVGSHEGVSYYNDSKATAPHAVIAAVAGFDDVVLIAGGRNKDLDLGELTGVAGALRAVVAIGEAASEIVEVFDGRVPTAIASSMGEAVRAAHDLASTVVLLSPGCASFDWYDNYQARGDAFRHEVQLLATSSTCVAPSAPEES